MANPNQRISVAECFGSTILRDRPGIYIITNKVTGKVYIGSASNISKRIHAHKKMLYANKHWNPHLQSSWNKYGVDSFEFHPLENTQNENDILTVREQFWMDFFQCYDNNYGYNILIYARSTRERKWTEEEHKRRTHVLNTSHMNTPEAVKRRVDTGRARNSYGKINWDIACKIREEYGVPTVNGKGKKNSDVSMQNLADKYNIGLTTVYDIIRYKTWQTEPKKVEETYESAS